MLVTPSKQSSSSLLYQDGLRCRDKAEMTSPLNASVGVVDGAKGRRGSTNSAFVSHRNSACSLDEYADTDDLTAAFLRGDSEMNGVTPSTSTNVLGSTSRHNNNNESTTPKRKPPHLFKQLASEFRWMHNNLKHGYHTGSTPKHQQQDSFGYLPTPQTTREDFGAPEEEDDEEEELLTMSLRSSLRRPSREASAPTSARDGTKQRMHTVGSAEGILAGKNASKKTRWRTMENGEVEAVEEPQVPQTTPDPFAPSNCRYMVHHPKENCECASAACAASGGTRDGNATLRSPLFSAAQRHGEEVTMPDAYLSDSLLSDEGEEEDDDDVDDEHHNVTGSRSARHDRSSESSDLEAVATMKTCPSDRRLAKVRYASDGILEDLNEDGTGHLTSQGDDSYEMFLSGIAQLQRQVHSLEQQTSELRKLYSREQTARLRSKGKGQHLSWTRTVQAANTIQFWRMKVNLLRNFESQYVNAVQQLQEELPLVDPEREKINGAAAGTPTKSAKGSSSATTAATLAQARRGFLRSSRVVTAQRRHLQALSEQLKACWQTNANLRDELRQFEQWEVRNPHDTFSVAGMDAEHFIASLPPRISAYALSGPSAKSSARSLDSAEDGQAPLLLLTAQNLSPTSDDDEVHTAAPPTTQTFQSAPAPALNGRRRESTNLARATGDAAPLASCIKGATSAPTIDTAATTTTTLAMPSLEASTSSSPSSPKRLKYVIQSAVFDMDDNNNTHNNSTSGRQSDRGGSNGSRSTTPLAGALASSAESQQRRRRERHVTFALEPEVLDARPRFSAHSRTTELLEQICMDKQVPWNGLTLLQTALEERLGELSSMQERLAEEEEEAQGALLARAITMTPRGEAERREMRPRRETAPSPTITPSPNPTSFEKTKTRGKRSKVKPKECAQCSVM